MVATHIKKIKLGNGILCVTGEMLCILKYLRDISNISFVILHLSVSCLSICSFVF